jgi:peptidoglycan/xylan/chitin deacetylase (PgdA/CDA1 family)
VEWVGSQLPSPQFKISETGELEPIEYPLWRKASDWLYGRQYVVLTFDDGPYGHGVDEQILSILAKYRARAIFFEVCAHITNDTINVPTKILSGGHLLGNHSYNHLHLPTLHGDSLTLQIKGCSHRIEEVSGLRPEYFRPPWGETSTEVLNAIHAAGMQQVLWDSNSGDTWLKSPNEIIRMSLHQISLGGSASILLMHSFPTTVVALEPLLADLKQRGARFVLPESSADAQ